MKRRTRFSTGARDSALLAALVLLQPIVAGAQLQPIESELTTSCIGESAFIQIQSYAANSCLNSEVISQPDIQATGTATISVATGPGGGAPFATTSAVGSADFQGGNIVIQGIAGSGHGEARLSYQVQVLVTHVPPVAVTLIPATISAIGSVTTAHTGSGGGSQADVLFEFVRAANPFPPVLSQSIGASSPPLPPFRPASDGFNVSSLVNLQVGTVFEVILSAAASVRAWAGVGGLALSTSSADAYVDPVFRFDQAAFDDYAAQQGFASFPLEDYFAFEFSAVPEPTGLLWPGLVGLALLTRRRRSR